MRSVLRMRPPISPAARIRRGACVQFLGEMQNWPVAPVAQRIRASAFGCKPTVQTSYLSKNDVSVDLPFSAELVRTPPNDPSGSKTVVTSLTSTLLVALTCSSGRQSTSGNVTDAFSPWHMALRSASRCGDEKEALIPWLRRADDLVFVDLRPYKAKTGASRVPGRLAPCNAQAAYMLRKIARAHASASPGRGRELTLLTSAKVSFHRIISSPDRMAIGLPSSIKTETFRHSSPSWSRAYGTRSDHGR
jgi:hypothetical protein